MTKMYKGESEGIIRDLYGLNNIDGYAGKPSQDPADIETEVRRDIVREYGEQPECELVNGAWRVSVVLSRGSTRLEAWALAHGAIAMRRLRQRTKGV